tara:strand:+ start:2803 stop:2931 length:129 start_codon:yes stop_codon:yes gene_type:complete
MTKVQRIYKFLRTETNANRADAREFAVKLARMSVAQLDAIRQ